MSLKKIASIAGISALAMAATSASQAATSSSSITHFSYSLVDLDPNDGIAPSLSLTSPSYWFATGYYPDGFGSPDPVDILTQAGTSSISTTEGDATSRGDGSANVSSVVNATGHPTLLAAHATTQWHFVLTPHTAVVLTGDGSIHGEVTDSVATDAVSQLFAAYRTTPAAPSETYNSDSLYAYYGRDQSRQLSINFSSGDVELSGRLGISTDAYGQNISPLPVPEPATYAMLMGGLLAVAAVSRRKQK